jgi:streptogramin lyase
MEEDMRITRFILIATTAVCLSLAGAHALLAADVALTGKVTSAEEGAMEGVVVSARNDGSTIRISVVTDARGQYGFPTAKVAPGRYTITIRAGGYDLDGASAAEVVANKTATVDLRLKKTDNLAAQLTNADWIASLPDQPARRGLASCTTCHTVQRILDSTYTAEDFMTLIPRMMRYGAMSKPNHPQIPADRQATSAPRGEVLARMADYFASVNRSGGKKQNLALKTGPRPTGRATRVIMTEYELPRPDITEPHDVIVDRDGTVWYSDFGDLFIGSLDPKTGKVSEHALPMNKPGAPVGSLDLELDADGNPWVAMMYQASVAKLDKKTGKVTAYPLPAEFDNPRVQIGMIDPRNAHVDGKVWFSEGGTRTFYRLDPETAAFEHIEPFRAIPRGTPHGAYGIASDTENNLWFMDFADRNVGRTDRNGATLIYPVPTPQSRPRRGHMTADGRLAFAEFASDRIGVIDIATQEIKEYPTTPLFAPYDAIMDQNGELWSGGMNSDTIMRIDTRTGASVSYLLPMSTNVRRVFVDNSTTPVTFWVGNNHHGNIVKLEPLD